VTSKIAEIIKKISTILLTKKCVRVWGCVKFTHSVCRFLPFSLAPC
jgi:hypothetical protein